MSHMVIGEGRIQQTEDDMAALRAACDSLGLVLCENQSEYKWYGAWLKDYHGADAAYKKVDPKLFGMNAKHVIRLPWTAWDEENYARNPEHRPYEIGLVEMADGTMAPVFDNFAGGKGVQTLVDKVGANGAKLVQLVNQFKVVNQVAKNKAHFIKSVDKLANGATRVVIGKKNYNV